jgi:hypothetical protein
MHAAKRQTRAERPVAPNNSRSTRRHVLVQKLLYHQCKYILLCGTDLPSLSTLLGSGNLAHHHKPIVGDILNTSVF